MRHSWPWIAFGRVALCVDNAKSRRPSPTPAPTGRSSCGFICCAFASSASASKTARSTAVTGAGAAIRSSSTAARSCCWTAEAPAQSRGHRARAVEIGLDFNRDLFNIRDRSSCLGNNRGRARGLEDTQSGRDRRRYGDQLLRLRRTVGVALFNCRSRTWGSPPGFPGVRCFGRALVSPYDRLVRCCAPSY